MSTAARGSQISLTTDGDLDEVPNRKSRLRSWTGNAAFVLALLLIIVGLRWIGLTVDPVMSGSMEPAISTGYLVVSIGHDFVTPHVGSVIVFDEDVDAASPGPESILHRIVAVNPDGSFVTKGDNNAVADPWSVRPDQVSRVLIGDVPTGSLN